MERKELTGFTGACIRDLNTAASNPNSEFYQMCEECEIEGWQNQYNILKSALQYDSASDMYLVSPELEDRMTSWGGDLSDIMDLITMYGQGYNPICEDGLTTVITLLSGEHSVGG